MRLIQSIFIFTVLFLCAEGSAEACESVLSEQRLIHQNHNATVPVSSYVETSTRSFEEYRNRFRKTPFDQRLSEMAGTSQVWLDSGAGFAFAPMDASKKKGVRTIGISAQDFLSPVRHLRPKKLWRLRRPRLETRTIGWEYTHISRVNDVDGGVLSRLGTILGVPTGLEASPHSPKILLAEPGMSHSEIQRRLKDFLTKLTDQLDAFEREGLFNFRVGFSEEVIPLLLSEGVQVGLVTDYLGAYMYSFTRKLLLETYYNSLAPGGIALIYFNSLTEVEGDLADVVGPDRVPFLPHLVERYPEIFQLISTTKTVFRFQAPIKILVIRKSPNVPTLDLPFELVAPEIQVERNASRSFARPQLVYSERP